MSYIYFDNFTTTEMTSNVEVSYAKWLSKTKCAYTAPYEKDQTLFKEIDQAVTSLYELVGADKGDHFHFASREEEALRHIFLEMVLPYMYETGKNHILTVGPVNISLPGALETVLEVDEQGVLTEDILERALTPRTSVLILPWVNRMTGAMNPIWEIGEICRKRGILCVVRGSEIFAKLFFRFRDVAIDILTFEGDKFHAPKGSGGFFVKKDSFASSYLKKGKIPYDAVPELIAMGVAARQVMDYMEGMSTEIARLRSILEDRLKNAIPELVIANKKGKRVPSAFAFHIPGIHPELFAFHLAARNILVNHDDLVVSCILSLHTTVEEIERLGTEIIEIAKELQGLQIR